MKVIKTASGNQIKMSKTEWEKIGRTAGWMKTANADLIEHIRRLVDDEKSRNSEEYYIAIEPSAGETYSNDNLAMYFYGTYPSSSVNEGMTMRAFVDDFANKDEATAAAEEIKSQLGIDVDISESSGYVKQELPMSPPSDFDPADAGEAWGEDDY